MGIAAWIAAAALSTLIARMIRAARPARWWSEPAIALVAAVILGALATALDFGGWNEPEWRAATFIFAGTLAALASIRLIRLKRYAARASVGAESPRR